MLGNIKDALKFLSHCLCMKCLPYSGFRLGFSFKKYDS